VVVRSNGLRGRQRQIAKGPDTQPFPQALTQIELCINPATPTHTHFALGTGCSELPTSSNSLQQLHPTACVQVHTHSTHIQMMSRVSLPTVIFAFFLIPQHPPVPLPPLAMLQLLRKSLQITFHVVSIHTLNSLICTRTAVRREASRISLSREGRRERDL
jgi:hypothetical protein